MSYREMREFSVLRMRGEWREFSESKGKREKDRIFWRILTSQKQSVKTYSLKEFLGLVTII
jgi:hypothetical protein